MADINLLLEKYNSKRDEIRKRLKEFKEILDESNERIFAELAFCICTPQSKANICWNAISSIASNGILFRGDKEKISPFLNSIRFGGNKSGYIIEARKKFTVDNQLKIKEFIYSFVDPFELRKWLAEHVKGLGMKEASHFLRNIGIGQDLAILDRHVLKNLKRFEVIKEIPKTLSEKIYLKIEDEMREFSKRIGIPIEELDLLFWSEETGVIFK